MPELPEVETMVRGIRPFAEGRTIAAVRSCSCRCRPLTVEPPLRSIAARSRGRRISGVRRLAKRVVLQLDSGDAFVIEPRMTGLMLAADPPDREHLRVEWEFADSDPVNRIWFWDRRGLGTIRLLTADELADLEHGGRFGPDPLTMSVDDWRGALKDRRRPIKAALLDQSLVAGIGNLYASEILHSAGIHPEHRADRLTRTQIVRLHQATRSILLLAIEYEGSTLGDGTYRNALNKSGGYQNSHRVYARERETCLTCRRGMVERLVQAQRSTFFCPVCQRRPRSVPSRVASGVKSRTAQTSAAARRTRG
jgi:formamidopyrimidine-DNA glycosylase